MAKALAIDHEKCTSCRLCELVCAQRNAGSFRPSYARIRVEIRAGEALYFPMTCIQCEDAPCMEACPTEALVRDAQTNAVVVVEELCEECGICESACPYGAIRCVDGKPIKCELCGGDPECVRFCASGALSYDSQGQWPAAVRQAYIDRLGELAKEARG
ncbi:MAG: 4Fe-4S dicluster domain-containing protein [Phycisphaerae bacterium]|nr:4Fe-4S dicluster domain-containing protein [Phycisphaerae bacterium]